ncbi:MAG TPA: protein kinase [Thermoanaerobaculia bacterium]|nr:protein kinase [Thermoanaerobaculia bacterium]
MDITPGTRLGPYEVVSRIGAGGMGEVFRGRDTRLDRSVAIKVLPAQLARNAQLKLRFEREAKTISQLNHPHICTLYDVGDDYLVMELLEGETLAERLSRGPLPLADALKYGAQIAAALDRAHRAGIIHRDLKPGNIMLTKSGAKLLDFGLAKSAPQPFDPNSATLQQRDPITEEGTILGTFQYMAPEQLEAEEADARTDLFALGAVLYEMVTGRRAFEGKTKTSLIAAIVGGQPTPVSQIMPLSPAALEHVIQKCLEKEREDRWQSAHDVAEELRWIAAAPAAEKTRGARGGKIAMAAAIALAIALAAVTVAYVRARHTPPSRTAFELLPPKGYAFGRHSISPDGTRVAFNANSLGSSHDGGIWTRALDGIEAKRLTTDGDDRFLAWSPDSKWIAYLARGSQDFQLRKIAATGGAFEVIDASVPALGNFAWGADGTFIYTVGISDGIFALRPGGGDPVLVTKCDRKRRETFHGWMQFLPDGKRFLYLVHTIASRKNEIWAGSIDGKLKQFIFRADGFVGVARGNLYFVRDGAIYAQRFDEKRLRLEGEPRIVIQRAQFVEESGGAYATVADTGALLYPPASKRRVEWSWFDRGGRRIEKVFDGEEMFARSLSHDGTRVAAVKFDPVKGANDVWIVDLTRGLRTRLTSGLAEYTNPLWSPDDNRVYFGSDRDGPYDIYAQSDDGASQAEVVWKSDHDKQLYEITPAGDMLLVAESIPQTRHDLWLVPVHAPEKRQLVAGTEADEYAGGISPDGRFVSYISDRSGRAELYVRLLAGGRTVQVTTEGAYGYIWAQDGKELLVRSADNARVSIPVTVVNGQIVPGKPTLLFSAPAQFYSCIADRDKRMLISLVPDPQDYVFPLHYDSAPLD